MTLLELKQELIDYANSMIPESYLEWLHVPSKATSKHIYLESKNCEASLLVLDKYHNGRKKASMQLNQQSNGCIHLQSYQADVSKHHLQLYQVFPGVNEAELVIQEKSSIRNNLSIALFKATEKGIFKYLKGLQQEGLIERLESE